MRKHKIIATYSVLYDMGIGIEEIDPYGDWVKFIWLYGNKCSKLIKSTLHSEYNIETQEDEHYFISGRRKYYLKDFMRTDICF